MNRISRRFIILSLLVIILMGFLIGDARSAQAATAITGFNLQVASGPSSNCATGTLMATVLTTVSGTPGGSGTYTLLFGLFGVNQSLPNNPVSNPDANLGTATSISIFNGSSWTAPGDTPRIQIDIMIGGTSFGGAVIYFTCATNGFTIVYTGMFAARTGAPPLFTDGRINNRPEDAAQTAAIYCTGDGGVTIWSVNSNSVGKFAFTATKAEIDKIPANPDQNTLIKKALNIALYRLHGGKLQVNAPNGYVYIWDGC